MLDKVFPAFLICITSHIITLALVNSQYVPLNSLTISSLYQDGQKQENQSTTG